MEDQKSVRSPVIGGGEAAGLSLLRATEAAALASGRLLGRADPENVKEVAWAAMRRSLEESERRARIVRGTAGDSLAPGTLIGSGPGPEPRASGT